MSRNDEVKNSEGVEGGREEEAEWLKLLLESEMATDRVSIRHTC